MFPRKSSVFFFTVLVLGVLFPRSVPAGLNSDRNHRGNLAYTTTSKHHLVQKKEYSKDSDVFQDPFSQSDESSPRSSQTIPDPFEPFNKWSLTFNLTFFEYVGRPLAEAYRDYTPDPIRDGMRNAFQNIYEPTYATNSLLQGKFDDADTAASRFLINSTFGAGGFYDVAKPHLEHTPHDFDQTLGTWGVEPTVYVVWPFIGPSSARGTAGFLVDSTMDPINYLEDDESVGLATIYRLVSETSYELGRYESLKKYSLDEYTAIKDVYEKRVYRKVHGDQ